MRLVKHPPLGQLGLPQRDEPFYRRRHLAGIVAFHVLEQLAQILSLHPLVENANKPTLVAMVNLARLERFARQNLCVMHRTAARRRQLMTQIQTLATLRHRRRRAVRVDQRKRPTLRNRTVVTNAHCVAYQLVLPTTTVVIFTKSLKNLVLQSLGDTVSVLPPFGLRRAPLAERTARLGEHLATLPRGNST